MKRRKFLWIALATAGLLGLGGWLFRSQIKRKNESLWTPSTLSQICSREKLLELGRKYRLTKKDVDPFTMEEQLLQGYDSNLQSREAYLRWKSDEDFIKGDTLLIDGWLLSETEAQQCALLSIHSE